MNRITLRSASLALPNERRSLFRNCASLPELPQGESWDRVKWSFAEALRPRPMESLVNLGDIYSPTIIDGTQWGSGPFMISQLAETPNCICWMDEGSGMWLTKAPTDQK